MDFLRLQILENLTLFLKLTAGIFALLTIAQYLWKRRWIYYFSWVLPGPLSLPFIGSPSIVFAGQKDVFRRWIRMSETYPPVWRMWIANQMYILTSRAQDVEYLLLNCLHKDNILLYEYTEEIVSSIFSTRLNRWKNHRKNINPAFNQKMLNSFFHGMVKHADKLTELLEEQRGDGEIQMLPIMWTNTLNTIFETLGRVDPKTLRKSNSKHVAMLTRYEELVVERGTNIYYYFNIFWKTSALYTELNTLLQEFWTELEETIDRHCCQTDKDPALTDKTFISRLRNGDYTLQGKVEEVAFMFVAGSETTANAVCTFLLFMSIYPEIQERVYEELLEVFGDDDITLEGLNKLEYLERVIKEAMRISPSIPCVGRYIDKTFELDGQTFPEGATTVIPIWSLHRNPQYWPDPLKFDPDRFLPEEVKKRPRCAYIPFSYGSRNCVGLKYAMMVIKIIIAQVLRKFEVKQGKYRSFQEIEMVFQFIAKPKEGCRIHVERRTGVGE